MTPTRLSDQIVARAPLGAQGASGNVLERVTLADGRELVCKRVSPEWDWLSRATGDDGRALRMWQAGLFDRIPPAIDHATVAVEPASDGWVVFMRDVSPFMVPERGRLDRAGLRRVLAAMAAMHDEFWGERFPNLCSLEDRYHLNSPRTSRREQERGHPVGEAMVRAWQLFAELAAEVRADDVATAVLAVVAQPRLLSEQLERCEPTLVHGDIRLANLGLTDDRVVLVDWGERTGAAPAPVELVSFLVFDAARIDVPRDDVISDFRALYADRFDERAFQLALIGALVQLGCVLVLDYLFHGGDDRRAAATSDLAWWTSKVRSALDTWSPV